MTSQTIQNKGVSVIINAPPGTHVDVQVNVDGCCGCDCGPNDGGTDRAAALADLWLELTVRGADEVYRGLAKPPEVLQGSTGITDLPGNDLGMVVASVTAKGRWTEDWILDPDVLSTFSLGQSFRLKFSSGEENLPDDIDGDWAQFSYHYMPIPRQSDLRRWPAAARGTISRRFEIEDEDGAIIGEMLREQDPSGIWFEHWILKDTYEPPGAGGNVVTLSHLGIVTQSAADFIKESTAGVANLSGWFYIGVAFAWKPLS